MSFAGPGGFSWLSLTNSASAGGQLEQPSEVKSSTTTKAWADASETMPTRSAANARNTRDFFILDDRTRNWAISFTLRSSAIRLPGVGRSEPLAPRQFFGPQ